MVDELWSLLCVVGIFLLLGCCVSFVLNVMFRPDYDRLVRIIGVHIDSTREVRDELRKLNELLRERGV